MLCCRIRFKWLLLGIWCLTFHFLPLILCVTVLYEIIYYFGIWVIFAVLKEYTNSVATWTPVHQITSKTKPCHSIYLYQAHSVWFWYVNSVECLLLRSQSKVLLYIEMFLFFVLSTAYEGDRILETCQYIAVQYKTVTNYDLNAKTWSLIITSMTE